jgi:ribosome-associated protein
MIEVSREIKFQTARSGGKGGQNVNKVETMVEGYFNPAKSEILNEEQKSLVLEKLASRITSEGFILIKSQVHRSQLSNKEEVIKKMNELITSALKRKKKRVATKPGKAARENRIRQKKKDADIKSGRKKIRFTDY